MDHILKDDINHINHEDWMSCLPEKLWDVPLTHLSIPGEPLMEAFHHGIKEYFFFFFTFVLRIQHLYLTILNSEFTSRNSIFPPRNLCLHIEHYNFLIPNSDFFRSYELMYVLICI